MQLITQLFALCVSSTHLYRDSRTLDLGMFLRLFLCERSEIILLTRLLKSLYASAPSIRITLSVLNVSTLLLRLLLSSGMSHETNTHYSRYAQDSKRDNPLLTLWFCRRPSHRHKPRTERYTYEIHLAAHSACNRL